MTLKFCSNCGTPYDGTMINVKHPHCDKCKITAWQNPKPVSVLVQPVGNGVDPMLGLLIAKRGISPKIGEYALPGGFVELDETFAEAAVREFREESGLDLLKASDMTIITDMKTAGGQALVFLQNNRLFNPDALDLLLDTDEMYGWTVRNFSDTGKEMCFPTHELVVSRWLKDHKVDRGPDPYYGGKF